jgi:hypothetical protein
VEYPATASLHPRIRHIERGAYDERDGDAFALNKSPLRFIRVRPPVIDMQFPAPASDRIWSMTRKNRYH